MVPWTGLNKINLITSSIKSCTRYDQILRNFLDGCFRSRSQYNHICARNLSVDSLNLDYLEKNILLRNEKNNIPLIRSLIKDLENNANNSDIEKKLNIELKKLPNRTHQRIRNYGSEPVEVMSYDPNLKNMQYKGFSELCKNLGILRMDHLGNYSGHKSYYLYSHLAELEQALIHLTLKFLKDNGFNMISVPDILPKDIIEGCGMQTDGERTQVYKLQSGDCLSGTSEMSMAGFYKDHVFNESELPVKLAAVSRCYRAETSGLNEEKGLYRVHQFTKVEMFAICAENESENVLESIKDLELAFYTSLGLKYRLLDMPPSELGTPAYQKYDIESWMPGRKMWGEVSSCSNCTDYQAKRLNIRYRDKNNAIHFAHTVNGTAAAIPRLLISLVEINQNEGGGYSAPATLQPYLKTDKIEKDKCLPEVKLIKHLRA